MSETPYNLDELRRLEKEATPGALQVERRGNSHLRNGMCVGLSRVDGIQAPFHETSFHQRDPRAVYMRDEDADFYAALRNAAAAGMLERMAKLENVAKACDMREYEAQQGSCAICNEPDCEDCPGNDIRVALGALDALRTKEPR